MPPHVAACEDAAAHIALLVVDAVGGVQRVESTRRPRRDECLSVVRQTVRVHRVDGARRGVAADLHRPAERPGDPGAAAVENNGSANAKDDRLGM